MLTPGEAGLLVHTTQVILACLQGVRTVGYTVYPCLVGIPCTVASWTPTLMADVIFMGQAGMACGESLTSLGSYMFVR